MTTSHNGRESKEKGEMTFRSRDFSTPQGPPRGQLLNFTNPRRCWEGGKSSQITTTIRGVPDLNGPFLYISGVLTIKVTLWCESKWCESPPDADDYLGRPDLLFLLVTDEYIRGGVPTCRESDNPRRSWRSFSDCFWRVTVSSKKSGFLKGHEVLLFFIIIIKR